jgi:hypothetical protein
MSSPSLGLKSQVRNQHEAGSKVCSAEVLRYKFYLTLLQLSILLLYYFSCRPTGTKQGLLAFIGKILVLTV